MSFLDKAKEIHSGFDEQVTSTTLLEDAGEVVLKKVL